MNRFACITISCLTITGCALDPAPATSPELAATGAVTASAIQHIFVIAMENHGASDIYGNTRSAPYINNTLLLM